MGFSVASTFQALVMVLNAMAILSERRFLSRYGLASDSSSSPTNQGLPFDHAFGGSALGVFDQGGSAQRSVARQQVAQLLSSIRMLLRWPLVFLNCAIVGFALIFG